MNKYIWIVAGLGVLSYVSYRIYKNSVRKNAEQETEAEEKIKPEVVEYLGMKDIVGYFKSLNLKQGIDKPFIAKGEAVKEMLDLSDPIYDGLEIICLGRHENSSDDIKDLKAIACKEVGKDVKDTLGTDKLVVIC